MGWTTMGAVKPNAMTEAATQLHYAAQWLGRFGRGLTPPKEDDSHTSFLWRNDWQAFLTDAAPIDGRAVQLGLRVSSLKLLLIIDSEIADEFECHGATDAKVGVWAREALQRLGADLSGFDADAPYAMPAGKIAKGGAYDAMKHIAELSEISRYYDNAQPVLEALASKYQHVKPGPSDARTWPHHFDTGVIITLEEAPFEEARAVGAGLAVPDSLFDEFYFYTYPWPRHKRDGMPKLKSIGRYQTEGFFGATLPASRLVREKDQAAAVDAFINESVEIWKRLVEREMAGE